MSRYTAFGGDIAALKVIIRSNSTEKLKQEKSVGLMKRALTSKMHPSPTILPVYILSDHAVVSRMVTQDPGVVRLHVNMSYVFFDPISYLCFLLSPGFSFLKTVY